ncbi:retrovirus-related pol polyprotein from transposon TNT 1-94 [Tanacetum coccineum]
MDISTPHLMFRSNTHLKAYEPHAKWTLKNREHSLPSFVDPLGPYVAHTTSATLLFHHPQILVFNPPTEEKDMLARAVSEPKEKDGLSVYFKDKLLPMEAERERRCTDYNKHVSKSLIMRMHMTRTVVDEGPNAAVAFMANLSSTRDAPGRTFSLDAVTGDCDNSIPYHHVSLDTEAQMFPKRSRLYGQPCSTVLYDADTIFASQSHPVSIHGIVKRKCLVIRRIGFLPNENASQASKISTPCYSILFIKVRPPSQVWPVFEKLMTVFPQFEYVKDVEQIFDGTEEAEYETMCSCEHTKVLELKAEISKQKQLITESEKRFAFLEQNYLDTGFNGKIDTIRNLDAQINIMEVLNVGFHEGGILIHVLHTLKRLSALHAENTKLESPSDGYTNSGSLHLADDTQSACSRKCQFCDGGLEVAFRCIHGHIRTLRYGGLLKASPVCLLTKASSTKSWLWHRRLNHLNFGTLNELARKNLVRGLPMLKYDKDHLCPSCQLGKSKKASHPLKAENTNTEVLHTLHMDLCGPMRTESINGKKYVLVIVDDYTRFGWVRFLRTKDETPQVIEKFIVKTQRALNATVRFVRTDNGTEFNGVVERRNRTLMEAARTMLIFAKAPLFLWAEAVATACYTLNRSLVHTLHGKTYYELLKGKKPNLQYFRVFGSLCYPTNDYDDVGKLKAKADIGIFVGYAPTKKAYRIYNKRTRKIQETVHVAFDELTEGLTSVQTSSGLAPQQMTSVPNSTELELTALQSGRSRSALVKDPEPPSVPPTKKQVDDLFQWFDDDEVVPIPPVVPITPVNVPAAPAPENANGSPSTTVISEGAPAVTESLLPHQIPLPDTSDSDVETLFDHVDIGLNMETVFEEQSSVSGEMISFRKLDVMTHGEVLLVQLNFMDMRHDAVLKSSDSALTAARLWIWFNKNSDTKNNQLWLSIFTYEALTEEMLRNTTTLPLLGVKQMTTEASEKNSR